MQPRVGQSESRLAEGVQVTSWPGRQCCTCWSPAGTAVQGPGSWILLLGPALAGSAGTTDGHLSFHVHPGFQMSCPRQMQSNSVLYYKHIFIYDVFLKSQPQLEANLRRWGPKQSCSFLLKANLLLNQEAIPEPPKSVLSLHGQKTVCILRTPGAIA